MVTVFELFGVASGMGTFRGVVGVRVLEGLLLLHLGELMLHGDYLLF